MSNRVTSANQWKSRVKGEEIEVPSGNIALVKKVSMDVFLRKGVLPNSLIPIVESALKTGKSFDASKIDIGADKLEEIIQMYDHVVYHLVVEPKLSLPPADGTPRDPEVLYVDDVDFEDKVFLFNWAVGGTANVEQFRKEQAKTLESLRPSQDVESKAKPTRKRK